MPSNFMFENCHNCLVAPDCNRYDAGCFYPLKDRSAEYASETEKARKAKWKRDNKDAVNAMNRAYRKRLRADAPA